MCPRYCFINFLLIILTNVHIIQRRTYEINVWQIIIPRYLLSHVPSDYILRAGHEKEKQFSSEFIFGKKIDVFFSTVGNKHLTQFNIINLVLSCNLKCKIIFIFFGVLQPEMIDGLFKTDLQIFWTFFILVNDYLLSTDTLLIDVKQLRKMRKQNHLIYLILNYLISLITF